MKLPDHWFFGERQTYPTFIFTADEMRHATKVLRMVKGDVLQWIDGRGGRYTGEISEISRHHFLASAATYHQEPLLPVRELVVGALHDATRLEWLVEKATELGVSKITIAQTQRVQRTKYRMVRLEAKRLSATKQAGGAWLPDLVEQDLSRVLAEAKAKKGQKIIAHCHVERERLPLQKLKSEAWQLLIGPEGDFTTEEILAAEAIGFQAVSLGQRRLRTETAAIAAISSLLM